MDCRTVRARDNAGYTTLVTGFSDPQLVDKIAASSDRWARRPYGTRIMQHSNPETADDWETLAIMRSTSAECIAMRTVTYACLVFVGMGISDQPFSNGSFFQTAGAQQVRQAQIPQQPRRPRQIPATNPTTATPLESGSPTASCDQQFTKPTSFCRVQKVRSSWTVAIEGGSISFVA